MGGIRVVVPRSIQSCADAALGRTWAGGGRAEVPRTAAMAASVLASGFADLATLEAMVRYHFDEQEHSDVLERDCYGGNSAPIWLRELSAIAENPWRKDQVSDRAWRYRANAQPPAGPRQCAFCGFAGDSKPRKRPPVEVGHVNGHEEDVRPANLIWTCRRCNVECGRTLQNAGLGRRVSQTNPGKGAQTLGQWVMATQAMRGKSDEMSVEDAVAMIHATPADKRSSFAREIWQRRRKRGTDKWASDFDVF